MRTRHVSTAALLALLALSGCGGNSSATGNTTGPGDGTTTTAPATDPTTGGSDASGTLNVSLMKDSVTDEIVDAAIAKFNEEYPNVEVDVQILAWDGRDAKWTAALSAQPATIDVLEMGNTDVLSWASTGALASLDPAQFTNSDTWLESLQKAGTYDGELYGVPYYAGGRVLWYNTEMVGDAEAPQTLDDLQELAAGLTEGNRSGLYLPGRNWYVGTSFLVDAGMAEIATEVDGQWQGNLASPEGIAGLERFKSFAQAVSKAPADADEANDAKVFAQEQAAMVIEPGWWSGVVTDPEGEAFPAESLSAWTLPGTDGPMPQFLGGSNLVVAANSDKQDLAIAFINALTSDEVMSQIAAAGTIPNTTTLIDQVPEGPAAMAAQATTGGGWFTPMSTKWSEVESKGLMQDLFQRVLSGEDVAAAAQATDEAIEAILNG